LIRTVGNGTVVDSINRPSPRDFPEFATGRHSSVPVPSDSRKKASPATIAVSALRILYNVTLHRDWKLEEMDWIRDLPAFAETKAGSVFHQRA